MFSHLDRFHLIFYGIKKEINTQRLEIYMKKLIKKILNKFFNFYPNYEQGQLFQNVI